MASPAIVIRNKQNAQQSTGPRTAEGKRKSSWNAVRHGLTSQLVVLPTENRADYEQFRSTLLADLKPIGAVESLLAQTACDTQWRLERARAAEANILARVHYEELPADISAIPVGPEREAILEAHAWTKYEAALRNIQHHEARLQRNLLKALAELRAVQESRKAETQQRLTEAACTKIHHESNNLPFDPAALGFVFTNSEIESELKRVHVLNYPRKPLPTFRPA